MDFPAIIIGYRVYMCCYPSRNTADIPINSQAKSIWNQITRKLSNGLMNYPRTFRCPMSDGRWPMAVHIRRGAECVCWVSTIAMPIIMHFSSNWKLSSEFLVANDTKYRQRKLPQRVWRNFQVSKQITCNLEGFFLFYFFFVAAATAPALRVFVNLAHR